MHCLKSGYFLPPLLLLLLLLAAATQTTSPTAANREEMPAESHPGNSLKKPTTHKSLSVSVSVSVCLSLSLSLCGHNQATAKCQEQVIQNLDALKTQLQDSFRELLLPTSLLRKLQETYEAVEQKQYDTHKNSQAISQNFLQKPEKQILTKKKPLQKSTSSSSDKSLLNQAGK
jgi:hypothetical protein